VNGVWLTVTDSSLRASSYLVTEGVTEDDAVLGSRPRGDVGGAALQKVVNVDGCGSP